MWRSPWNPKTIYICILSCSSKTNSNLVVLYINLQLEREEWAEFQADLQTAVVVANNFKMEAQEDIDMLTDEREQLEKDKSLLTELVFFFGIFALS